MDISVIIPTFNGKHLLEKSLPLLVQSLEPIGSSEIIIVDNHSTDGTEETISHQYPHIVYIPLPENKGFTRAVNEGAHKAHGRTILIMNNDCFLEKDTITGMYDFLHQNHQYVATQPVVYTKRNTIEHIGYVVDKSIARASVIKRTHDLPKPGVFHDATFSQRYVYGLSATCLLMYKDVFVDIGMFDQSFHSYLEDVDLFFRLQNKGYQWYPTLTARCTHAHMATSKKMGPYKEIHDFTNWIKIIHKNYTSSDIVANGFSLLVERLRNLNGILKKMIQLPNR